MDMVQTWYAHVGSEEAGKGVVPGHLQPSRTHPNRAKGSCRFPSCYRSLPNGMDCANVVRDDERMPGTPMEDMDPTPKGQGQHTRTMKQMKNTVDTLHRASLNRWPTPYATEWS